ncbi:MAG: hypothetical protein WCI73_20625 [Phycisphaerae bacterium]
MPYYHIQTGKLSLILLSPIVVVLIPAWLVPTMSVLLLISVIIVGTLILCALCFHYLLVCDEGDYLALRFGPIPFFSKRLPYAQMTAVEPARSTFLDGWGIHYTPGRGWIYNLWGFDCVKVQMGKKTVRIGTDDVPGLVAFLKRRIG